MKDTATYRRTAVAGSLVAAPFLALVSVALHPEFAPEYVDRLAGLDEAGAAAWVSNVAFTASQVPMLVAFLGIAHLLRHRSPRLSNLGATLGVLATFGEAVMGGVAMVWITAAPDAANRETFAGVWERLEGSPVMLFAVVGFGGTVLTLLLLSVALFRTRLVPRWAPVLIWTFLALEFVGSSVSAYASYAAVVCLLIGYAAIAAHVWRSPRAAWDTADSVAEPAVAAAGATTDPASRDAT